MGLMRTACLILAATYGLAAPAAAQDTSLAGHLQLNELWAQQRLAEQRAVSQANDLSALEARVRSEQALSALEALRARPALPELPYPVSGPPPAAAQVPEISDARLAASNARVREALAARR